MWKHHILKNLGGIKMSLRNRSVLVTGGAGFIGSHLVDKLIKKEPDNLVVVDNFFLGKESNLRDAKENFDKLKIYHEDASNFTKMKKILREENIEVVFNLAIIPLPTSLAKPKWSVEVNVGITNVLCNLIREGVFDTLIHCSSSEAYGSAQYVPMDEKHPLNPTTPYAMSKAATDHLVLSFYQTFEIDATIVRPFNNYGPRQNEKAYAGVIPTTIKRILDGLPPIIFGDGEQTRDYIFVTDTAKAMIDVHKYKKTRGEVINIASGKEISISELIRRTSEIMGYNDSPIYKEERIGDVRRHLADISLAKKLIGFEPSIGIEDGLKKTIQWYNDTFRRIK